MATKKHPSNSKKAKIAYDYSLQDTVSSLPSTISHTGRKSQHTNLYSRILALKKGEWTPVKFKSESGIKSLSMLVRAWFYKYHPDKAIHTAIDPVNHVVYFGWSKAPKT